MDPKPPPTLETLHEDVLLYFMKDFDIPTLLAIISASPVAYRLFKKERAYICQAQLGKKYVLYKVPTPLVDALHLVHGRKLRPSESFWEEPQFPWTVIQGIVPAAQGMGKLEFLPGWVSVLATCYVSNYDSSDGDVEETWMSFSSSSDFHVSDHAITIVNLLSTRTLAWMDIGIKLVKTMEEVADKLQISLIPATPETDYDAYPVPGYKPIGHLQFWLHELRCHVRDTSRVDMVETFAKDDDTSEEIHEELFEAPFEILEEQAESVEEKMIAMAAGENTPALTPREHDLAALALCKPEDKERYEAKLWEAGAEMFTRLCHMTPREREEFHLEKFVDFLE